MKKNTPHYLMRSLCGKDIIYNKSFSPISIFKIDEETKNS